MCKLYATLECANFEECHNTRGTTNIGNPYCGICLNNGVPGRDKQCVKCGALGTHTKYTTCRKCFVQLRNERLSPCTLCDRSRDGYTVIGSSNCSREDCYDVCQFRDSKKIRCKTKIHTKESTLARKPVYCEDHRYAFKCHSCQKSFTTKGNLKTHWKGKKNTCSVSLFAIHTCAYLI